MRKRWLAHVWMALLGALIAGGPAAAEPSALATAERLLAAFNQHDPDAMAALVSEDFELYYVSEGKSELGAQGREDLRIQMVGYFAERPTVRSEIEDRIDGPRFASFRERAGSLHADGSHRSASSLAVYEVVDGLIIRVWYYPAEAPRKTPPADQQ